MSEAPKAPTAAELNAQRLQKKKETILAFQRLFAGKGGPADANLVMDDLRKRCYYDYPTYSKGDSDRDGAIREGLRMAYLHIRGRMNADLTKLNLTPEDE